MSTNRRQFLITAGLAGFGMAGVGKLLSDSVGTSHSVSAVPLPKSKLLQRFAVLADTGTGGRKQYEVARALVRYHRQNPFDTVLLAGDNIYTNGEFAKIESVFKLPYQDLLSRGVKFYACLGNHDIREDNGDRQVRYPEFNMQGKRYYTHGKGDVRFFVLETNDLSNPLEPDTAQIAWLDRELTASKAKWKIVYGHHPVYTAGVYHHHPRTPVMQRLVAPILKKHNVKLWINGHDHNYQRSKPIDGTTYLTCGGGGAGLYPIKHEDPWREFAQSIHSFGIVEVYQDQLILTGVDSYSQIIDQGVVMA